MVEYGMTGRWECLNGHAVHDERARTCPECGADIVWKPESVRPSAGPAADADQAARTPRAHGTGRVPGPSPWAWVILGLVLGGFGGVLWLTAEDAARAVIGLVILMIGATVNAIGIVAVGVRIGIEASRAG